MPLQATGYDPSPGTCRLKAKCLDKKERVILQIVCGGVADREQLKYSSSHMLNVTHAVAIIAAVVVGTLQNKRKED